MCQQSRRRRHPLSSGRRQGRRAHRLPVGRGTQRAASKSGKSRQVIMEYSVISIDPALTTTVRERMVSPQYPSLSAVVSVANGYGPCRSCLRVFDQGNENRIFFTYNAFEGSSDLPDAGPVFIHERDCPRYEGNALPADLLGLPLLFEAFGEGSEM